MSTQTNEFPIRPQHEPGKFTKILWWFSTAIPELIQDCKSDQNRAKIIGAGVAFTWFYATVAWIYFWSMNISSIWLAIPLGILIGFGILSIDRMLIASINKKKKSWMAISFRVVLALLLGAFIAQPILLWMFDKDISQEIAIVQDIKVQEKRQELQKVYSSEKTELQNRQQALLDQKSTKYAALEKAEQEYLKEIDGTGGSGKFGIAGIAREKEKAYKRAEEAYKEIEESQQKEILLINNRLLAVDSTINAETASFRKNKLSEGFLIRVGALQSLFQKDEHIALRKRYYLILIILVFFELIPIISKLYLPTGSYDERVLLQDELELKLAETRKESLLNYHLSLNEMSTAKEQQTVHQLLELTEQQKAEIIEDLGMQWRQNPQLSFEQFWSMAQLKLMRNKEF
jgi:hypothetical protein